MCRFVCLALTTALAIGGAAPTEARAGSTKFFVKNESRYDIIVVADTDRESWHIPAGATACFVKLNLGDQVTLRAWESGPDKQRGRLLGTECFGTPVIRIFPPRIKRERDIRWTGSRFTSND